MSSRAENVSTTTPGAVRRVSPGRGVEARMLACALAGRGASASSAARPAATTRLPSRARSAMAGILLMPRPYGPRLRVRRRVHGLDLGAVALHDDPPAHLQRRRELTRLRGPLRAHDREAP